MLRLLNKTLISVFYQQHAGLFIVVLYLLFGAVEGSQIVSYHKALMLAIVSSPAVLLLVFALWSLYGIKCCHFINKTIKKSDYHFLTILSGSAKNNQYRVWIYVYILCFLPIIIYAALGSIMAFSNSYFFSALATPIFLILLIIVVSVYTFKTTNNTHLLQRQLVTPLKINSPKPYWSWSLHYFLTEQKIAFIVTKLVSFLFFKAMLWVFADVEHQLKVYLTAMLATVLSHAVLLLNLVKFEANYLGFIVPLPIRKANKVGVQLLVLALMILPELLLLFWSVNFDLTYFSRVLVFSISALVFLKALVIAIKADMENYMKWLLFYFFITMLAILGSYDLLLSGISLLFGLTYLTFNRKDVKTLV